MYYFLSAKSMQLSMLCTTLLISSLHLMTTSAAPVLTRDLTVCALTEYDDVHYFTCLSTSYCDCPSSFQLCKHLHFLRKHLASGHSDPPVDDPPVPSPPSPIPQVLQPEPERNNQPEKHGRYCRMLSIS